MPGGGWGPTFLLHSRPGTALAPAGLEQGPEPPRAPSPPHTKAPFFGRLPAPRQRLMPGSAHPGHPPPGLSFPLHSGGHNTQCPHPHSRQDSLYPWPLQTLRLCNLGPKPKLFGTAAALRGPCEQRGGGGGDNCLGGAGGGTHSGVAQGFPAGQRPRQAPCQGHERAEPAGAVCTLLLPPAVPSGVLGGNGTSGPPTQGDSPWHRPPTLGGHPAPGHCSPCTGAALGCGCAVSGRGCCGGASPSCARRPRGWGWVLARFNSRLAEGAVGECSPPGNGAGAGGHWHATARTAWRDPAHPLPGWHSCTEQARALLLGQEHTWGKAHIGAGSKSHPPCPKPACWLCAPVLGHAGLQQCVRLMEEMGWVLVGPPMPTAKWWVLDCVLGGSRQGHMARGCQGAGGFLGLAGRGRGNEAASARRLADPSGTGRSRQSGAGDTARAKDFL